MRPLFLILVILPGCKALGYESPCKVAEIHQPAHVTIHACQGGRDDWGVAVSDMLGVYDEILADRGLTSMSLYAHDYEIHVTKREPNHGDCQGNSCIAGRFFYGGWFELYPDDFVDGDPGRALAHELWHLYEHHDMWLSEARWQSLQRADPPRHFLLGNIAQEIIDQAKMNWAERR